MTIGASHFRIDARARLFPVPAKASLLFEICWSPGEAETDPLWEAIPLRHTNRRLIFRGPGLGADARDRLAQVVDGLPQCRLDWLDEPDVRGDVLRLMRLAEGERFRSRIMHAELFSAVRFDVGWNQTCEEGLPPAALEIEPPLRASFAQLRHWSVMRLINLLGGYRLLGWRAADLPARLAPNLGVISVDECTDAALFNAGRAFERVWLALTQLGISLQPMPAAALYALEGSVKEGIPGALQDQLQRGWSNHLGNRRALMVFRAGKARPPQVTTSRKALDSYCT